MRFVSYIRVSTQQQGRSGLGLDAQRNAVADYASSTPSHILQEFVEVETGKGANALDRRPQLRAALALCRKEGATLLIAKLDRLARNVAFIAGLLESNIEFVAVDMPNANKTMLHIHSVMAEWERDQISARTREALAAAKARGVRLGSAGPANLRSNTEARQALANDFAVRLRPLITALLNSGFSQRAAVQKLNETGVKAPRGGRWSLVQLQRALKRPPSFA